MQCPKTLPRKFPPIFESCCYFLHCGIVAYRCGIGLDVWFTALSDECISNPGKQSVLFIFTEFFNWKSNLQKTYKYIAGKEKGFKLLNLITYLKLLN